MTENEAIEELKYDYNELGKAIPCDTGWGIAINSAYDMAIKSLEEIQQYRAIGTVDECREARERQRIIKPIFEMNFGDCESKFSCECGKKIVVRHDRGVMYNHDGPNYCPTCGCKFDWIDNE